MYKTAKAQPLVIAVAPRLAQLQVISFGKQENNKTQGAGRR